MTISAVHFSTHIGGHPIQIQLVEEQRSGWWWTYVVDGTTTRAAEPAASADQARAQALHALRTLIGAHYRGDGATHRDR